MIGIWNIILPVFLTVSEEGILLFASEVKSANFVINSLLASTVHEEEIISRDLILPVDLAAILSIRLQSIGLLDDLVSSSPERRAAKWTKQHWSPFQGSRLTYTNLCSTESVLQTIRLLYSSLDMFHY